MKLTDRVNLAKGIAPADSAPVAARTAPGRHSGPTSPPKPAPRRRQERVIVRPVDPLAEFKEKAAQQLFDRIGSRINDSELSEEKLHAIARDELLNIVSEEQVPLTAQERSVLIEEIGADVLGFGPL